ncbi:hypothetical protein [Vibrio phage vB_VpaP_SJSY21]|nr:hypothetical protein [Vibrio phage vB_VpaP_SJSY21]
MLDALVAKIGLKLNTVILRLTGLEDRVRVLEEERGMLLSKLETKDDNLEVVSSPDNWATTRVSNCKTSNPRGYVQWNASEERYLREAFDRGVTIKTLSEEHGRSENAIFCRLVKMGYNELEIRKCLYTQ